MRTIIDLVLIILWVVIGIITIWQPVSKTCFYCLLACLIVGKIEEMIVRKA